MTNPAELRERMYSDEEIVELVQKAICMGLPVDTDKGLANLNIGELERLVTVVQ